MLRTWIFGFGFALLLTLFACNDGKKKVAGGYMDETETTDLTVSGILLGMDQKPFARQVVRLNEAQGAELSDTTDSTGEYEFEKVQPGHWYLVAEDTAQGLLREIVVDSQDIVLGTDTLESLLRVVLVRSEQVSDTVYIVQLHRTVVLQSDSVELLLPQGEYDFNRQLASSSSSSPSMSSSLAIAGPATIRYLFADDGPLLDSSGNGLALSVASGTPSFAAGSVGFYGASCLLAPYRDGVFGSHVRMSVRLKLRGTSTAVQGIFCNDDGAGMGDIFCLRRRGLDTLEFKFQASVLQADSVFAGGVAQDLWMTVSAEIDSNNVATLYLDGAPLASKVVAGSFSGGFHTDSRIGCRNQTLNDPHYFIGDIDSLSVLRL